MSARYTDDKIHCFRCGLTGCISYTVIDSPALTWAGDDDVNNTLYFGVVHDCECRNCSAQFLIQDGEP